MKAICTKKESKIVKKWLISVPLSLHTATKGDAAAQRVTVNDYIINALMDYLQKRGLNLEEMSKTA
ncbi:MAG: hypothetical protein HQK96_09435 [Nitrospirae bacterium]|nr:hypothetical protein [Nitrospirota bacterium]